jgi:hypothetical protein
VAYLVFLEVDDIGVWVLRQELQNLDFLLL